MRTIKRAATAVALAVPLALGGGLHVATAAEAATCCLKIPNGTWGGYVRTVDVHMWWRDYRTEVRRKTVVKYRMVDGRWQERVYSIEMYAVYHGV